MAKKITLANELSFALQFAKMNIEQIIMLNEFDVPSHINSVDAQISEGMTPEQINDTEFQFQVVYTLTANSKSKAHIRFVNPESAEGKEIHNVLTKKVIADDIYPYKPNQVVKLVNEKLELKFTTHNHQQAIRRYKVRPKTGAKQPGNTIKEYCIYHATHKDYTYSEDWVKKLIDAVSKPDEFSAIKAVKLN